MSKSTQPRTKEEAVQCILRRLTDDQRAAIRTVSQDQFVLANHFGLGLWIRNTLIYSNPNRERLEADLVKADPTLHPDPMSEVLLGDAWAAVQLQG